MWRVVTIPAPGVSSALIFDSPLGVVEGMAMKVLPPSDNAPPYMKSCWPPTPEMMRSPTESAHTCPVRSTSTAELMAMTRGFCRMRNGSLVHATSFITRSLR